MADIEKQLERIADKVKLREWIDALPDDAEGLILVRIPHDPETCEHENCSGEAYRHAYVGEITNAGALYATRTFEHHLMGCV